jgi:hypothetical protein
MSFLRRIFGGKKPANQDFRGSEPSQTEAEIQQARARMEADMMADREKREAARPSEPTPSTDEKSPPQTP